MKIYIASKFKYVDSIKKQVKFLELAGHEIVCKWWEDTRAKDLINSFSTNEWYNHDTIKEIAERDFKAIRECDALYLYSPDTSKEECFSGAYIELGYALALRKTIFIQANVGYCALLKDCVIIP